MTAPGDWMAVYVNDQDREIQDESTSLRIRFFDNADRNRTFEALFEQQGDGGTYRISELKTVVLASAAGLVTPAPAKPTPTPTTTHTPLPCYARRVRQSAHAGRRSARALPLPLPCR